MYYPKSQIRTNLFTNGKQFINSSTKEEYNGYYYEISTGQQYTGKTPEDGPNILLIPIPSLSNFLVDSIAPPPLIISESVIEDQYSPPSVPVIRSLPIFNPTLPTPQDQQNGQFTRYFCKKTNENKYLEIDKPTYQKLTNKDPQIAWDLYIPAQIIWIIKGDKTQAFTSNKGSVSIIEQQRNWYGFTQWFKDKFLQYYLES
jgi:hypothetical protein